VNLPERNVGRSPNQSALRPRGVSSAIVTIGVVDGDEGNAPIDSILASVRRI
jgi:hypothetical protein